MNTQAQANLSKILQVTKSKSKETRAIFQLFFKTLRHFGLLERLLLELYMPPQYYEKHIPIYPYYSCYDNWCAIFKLLIGATSLDKSSWWSELYYIRIPNGTKIYTKFKNDYYILHRSTIKTHDFYCNNQPFDISISDMRYSV